MLCPRDGNVDPVVLLDKIAGLRAHHSNEDDIELATLGTIDGNDLILGVGLDESVCYGILLGIVRRNHEDTVARKPLLSHRRDLLVQLLDFWELADAQISHIYSCINFLEVDEWSALELLLAIGDIDKEERLVGVEEDFLDVWNVATLDQIIIEKQVRHFHQALMHSVLSVKERVGMARLYQPFEKGGGTLDFEAIGWA